MNAQAVVILAGGVSALRPSTAGRRSPRDTLERLDYGAYHCAPDLAARVGHRLQRARRRRCAPRSLRDFDITPRWVDTRSGDTFDNARFSARLLRADHVSRIILVTTGMHEWRAAHEFMAAGLQVMPAPVGNRIPQAPACGQLCARDRCVDALSRGCL